MRTSASTSISTEPRNSGTEKHFNRLLPYTFLWKSNSDLLGKGLRKNEGHEKLCFASQHLTTAEQNIRGTSDGWHQSIHEACLGRKRKRKKGWKFEKKEDLKPPASNKKEKTQPTTNLGKFQRKETCKKATENCASLRQTPLEGRRGDIIWGGFRAGCAVLKKIGLLFGSRRSK